MFSVKMMPMSTIVPIAIAMPDKATMFASMPNAFMRMKQASTATGNKPLMSSDERTFITMTTTTMMVIKICRSIAVSRVAMVSLMSPDRS